MREKPLILAVETSGRTGSVAIALGDQMLAQAIFAKPMRHSTEVFPAINSLLKRVDRRAKEIQQVYISAGPGSFTGLRIAVTLAKIMHLTNAARVVAVNTLDVIAMNATDYINEKNEAFGKIATVLDAKRGQFFVAAYERISHSIPAKNRQQTRNSGKGDVTQGIWGKILPDSLLTASEFLETLGDTSQPTWLLGEGLVYYKHKFKAPGVRFLDRKYWYPRASKVHLLGWEKASTELFVDPVKLQPAYMRRPDVKIKRQT
jgi:tRNA threonylcarbamoyladenosine biosynthesis protein TsaB